MVAATVFMTTRGGSKQYVFCSRRSGYFSGVVVLIRSWHGNAFCYSCGGMYSLQNIKKLLLGDKEDGTFIWDRILVESLGFQRRFCVHQRLNMFHMAAVLSFTVTTEFC